jgi:hypothetical protein
MYCLCSISLSQELLEVSPYSAQTRYTIQRVACKMKAIEIVQHRHIERGRGGTFFLVPAHVQVIVVLRRYVRR